MMSWVITNWINSEDISSLADIRDAEKWLSRATDFFNKGKYHIHKTNSFDYAAGAERVNEEWRDASFWYIPKRYITIQLGQFQFNISIHAYLNQEFKNFMDNERYKNEARGIIDNSNSRLEIERKQASIFKKLNSLHEHFSDELKKVAGKLQRYIRKNAVRIEEYEPHYSGSKDGKDTEKMLELIYNAELAYRGVLCGNDFAYDWLMVEYISDEGISNLKASTNEIVHISKEYLAVQMALKFKKSNKGREAEKYEEFIPAVRECIEKERAKISTGKVKNFLTSDRKAIVNSIAEYLIDSEKLQTHYSLGHLKQRVIPRVLPQIDEIEEGEKGYYKK